MSIRRLRLIVALALAVIVGAATGLLVLAPWNTRTSHRRAAAPVVRRVRPRPARIRGSRAALGARRFQLVERAALAHFQRLGLPVLCGGFRGHDVALTFDDGPGPYTAEALAILRLANARATFFLTGKELRYWPY